MHLWQKKRLIQNNCYVFHCSEMEINDIKNGRHSLVFYKPLCYQIFHCCLLSYAIVCCFCQPHPANLNPASKEPLLTTLEFRKYNIEKYACGPIVVPDFEQPFA